MGDFRTELDEPGLAYPLLVISDGAAGLVGAVERTMGAALSPALSYPSRCRNVVAQVPRQAATEIRADYWAIFDVPDNVGPGPDAAPLKQ